MKYTLRDQVIALAGVFQSCHMVQRIARSGMADTAAMEACLYSIFMIDADSTAGVYGGLGQLKDGLRLMVRLFDGNSPNQDMEITRYSIGAIQLERRLIRDSQRLQRLQQAIAQAEILRETTGLMEMTLIHRLAGIYEDFISPLTPRIIVHGEPAQLANPDNAARIRALLLAAVRSAVLWRQTGGHRLQLIFSRRKYLRLADAILKESPAVRPLH
jgi:high frequency lysogenization protein